MRSPWKCDSRVWEDGDTASPVTLLCAASLLLFAIFIMPEVVRKFLGERLTVPDILLFSAMPGIIAYRFFCAEKIPLKKLAVTEIVELAGIAFLLLFV